MKWQVNVESPTKRKSSVLLSVLCFLLSALIAKAQITVSDGGAGKPSSLMTPKRYYWTNPVFHYWFPTTNAFISDIYNGTNEVGGGMLDSTNTFAPLQLSFMVSNTASFEVKSLNQDYGTLQVRASDGLTNCFSTVNWGKLYPNSSPTFYLVTMPYATNWNVTLAMTLGGKFPAYFWGVNVPTNAAVCNNTLPRQRIVVVLGDSYAKGFIASSGSQFLQGFAWDLWPMAPNILIYPAGISGQGYVNPNNQPPNFQARLTNDVINLNPDYVLVTGTINDNGYTNVLLGAALQLYQTLTNQLPNAKTAVIGNWYRGANAPAESGPTSDDIIRDNILQAAANQCGLPYASPVQGLWGAGGVGTDSIHPTMARYLTYAYDINTNMINWWGTNWNQGAQSAVITVQTNSGPQIMTTTLANGTNGFQYSQQLQATGGQPPYTWSVTSGALPASLSLSSNGLISGTITASSGAYNFTVGLTDSLGASTNQAITLVMVATNLLTTPVLNVADFGAKGDAVSFTVSTVSNSTVVSVMGTNTFSSADIGKVIEVFRAGPWLSYSNWGVVVTQQDIICTITNVSQGTNLSLSIPCGWTTNAYCVVGTNNGPAFQSAINAASVLVANGQTTNVTIGIPVGRYLMVSSSVLNPNYVMGSISDTHPALTVSSGGITFFGLGDLPANTVLMGCGAGMEHRVSSSLAWISGGYAPYVPMRDTLIFCRGPVVNNQYPLVFQNLTLDGGLTNGAQSYNYWTPIQGNGAGWDTTHHAVADFNPFPNTPQMHQLKVFTNCVFQHWRGEMLICWTATGGTNTFNDIANCTFWDGNATADNLYYGQHVHGCTFNHVEKVTEYYQANAMLPTVFENNLMTNIAGNILVINGATTNANPPSYVIQNNTFYGIPNVAEILFTPAENVIISNNVFHGQASGISFSAAGLQPANGSAAVISNIVIVANSFNDTFLPIIMDGYPVVNVLVSNNTSASGYSFAMGGAGFKTNIILAANVASANASSVSVQSGNYFVDQPSDQLGWYQYNDWSGLTNRITYGNGRKHLILHAMTNSVFQVLSTNLIPRGAMLQISNTSPSTVPLLSGITLSHAQSVILAWNGNVWLQQNQFTASRSRAAPLCPFNLIPRPWTMPGISSPVGTGASAMVQPALCRIQRMFM